ncbi:MAG: helix-turn-helix transcriptional regulator [Actinobacteria bacterium]|nr:helix-turn-helix transcriptional regulator [Actinomycetota bacterium]
MDPGAFRGWDELDTGRARQKSDSSHGGGHSGEGSGWPSLTPMERRIALMVADGTKNADVAQELFLSRHTVDYHLRQIFVKLGVRSRVQLARFVGERGGEVT